METATFPFELDTQAGKESVLQYGYLTLSVAREIQEQGYCCLHWQCGKNSPAASVPAAASSGKSRDGYSQVFYCSFLQKGWCWWHSPTGRKVTYNWVSPATMAVGHKATVRDGFSKSKCVEHFWTVWLYPKCLKEDWVVSEEYSRLWMSSNWKSVPEVSFIFLSADGSLDFWLIYFFIFNCKDLLTRERNYVNELELLVVAAPCH